MLCDLYDTRTYGGSQWYTSHRSGRAILSPTPVNTAVSPSGGPSSDDCYTTLLHNPDDDLGSSSGKVTGKQPGVCYTNDRHKRPWIMWRSGRLYYRQRVPTSLLSIVGKREIWRSLGTDSPTVALRRSHEIATSIERDFEAARSQAGLPVDHKILSVADPKFAIRAEASSVEAVVSLTLREVYDTYMTDPTRDWSPQTRMAYEATRRQALPHADRADRVQPAASRRRLPLRPWRRRSLSALGGWRDRSRTCAEPVFDFLAAERCRALRQLPRLRDQRGLCSPPRCSQISRSPQQNKRLAHG